MHKGAIVLFLIVCAMFSSCRRNAARSSSFFDSLVVEQARQLSRAKATLKKVSYFDGLEEKVASTPNAIQWENELGIFKQLSSYQRPAYHSIYQIDDSLKDPSSNLVVRRYHAKGDVPVPELKFYYFQQFKHLKKIVATYQQRNLLYSTSRQLILEFEDTGGQPVLSSYQIAGTQKMIMNDSVKFTIRSEITN